MWFTGRKCCGPAGKSIIMSISARTPCSTPAAQACWWGPRSQRWSRRAPTFGHRDSALAWSCGIDFSSGAAPAADEVAEKYRRRIEDDVVVAGDLAAAG